MSLLTWLFGGKQKPAGEMNAIITADTVPKTSSDKNARRDLWIDGKQYRIEFCSNRQTVLDVNDPEEYWHDDRRWVDIYCGDDKHGYAWPEGHWTHTADNLPEKRQIERWICEEFGLMAPPAAHGDFKATDRQTINKSIIAHARFGEYIAEATFAPRGHVVKLEIGIFKGRYNAKTREFELPERLTPLAPGLERWLVNELETAKIDAAV